MFKKFPLIPPVLLVLSILFVISQSGFTQEQRSRAISNCDVTAAATTIDSEEQNFLTLVNQYRATKGAGPLTLSPNLTRSSSWMSHDMATTGNFAHNDSTGRTVEKRLADCGYTGNSDGENIAEGNADAAGTLKQWQSDKGHDDNLIDPSFTSLGIAREQGSQGWVWTQDVGVDATSGSVGVPSSGPVSNTTPTIPPNTIPSSVCLGGCLTLTPLPSGGIPLSNAPLPGSSNPINLVSGSPIPSTPFNNNQTINPTNSLLNGNGTLTNQPGGLLGFLLSLILLIFQFFQNLF
jgi:uncharacterized protein YkwD